jgi:hypothetical protein
LAGAVLFSIFAEGFGSIEGKFLATQVWLKSHDTGCPCCSLDDGESQKLGCGDEGWHHLSTSIFSSFLVPSKQRV